jgi:hypothetical protein
MAIIGFLIVHAGMLRNKLEELKRKETERQIAKMGLKTDWRSIYNQLKREGKIE